MKSKKAATCDTHTRIKNKKKKAASGVCPHCQQGTIELRIQFINIKNKKKTLKQKHGFSLTLRSLFTAPRTLWCAQGTKCWRGLQNRLMIIDHNNHTNLFKFKKKYIRHRQTIRSNINTTMNYGAPYFISQRLATDPLPATMMCTQTT